eukprot:2131293-Amphidinium_carterae.1
MQKYSATGTRNITNKWCNLLNGSKRAVVASGASQPLSTCMSLFVCVCVSARASACMLSA